MDDETPCHPYWCDECGGNAGFRIPGLEIDHRKDCPRYGEDAMEVYNAAVEYIKRTGLTVE